MDDNSQSRNRLIRDTDPADRPREKAMRHGIKSLTDAELMALIFATGLKGKSVIDLSNDILADNGNHLSVVASLDTAELCRRYKGIGKAKAITLLAALELGSRSAADALKVDRRPINTPDLAYELMRHHFERLTHEEFWVAYLDRGGHVIKEAKVSQGGTGATVVDVKIVLREALSCLASSMLLFHNHPSGTLMPSPQDDSLTQKIKSAAEIMDLRVNDHIIITDASYYSYSDHGRI